MEKYITLAHGDGGERSHQLIQEIFVEAFGNQQESMFDSTQLQLPSSEIAVTTDSFVIKPLFFPGGTIGKLAVCGTVNDLAVSGAKPLYLTCGFIIEEGFPVSDLIRIVEDMSSEASKAGVTIIAGDTKVVERGCADGVYINTTGIGIIEKKLNPKLVFREGDSIIVTGTIGDHGMAVFAARENLGITVPVDSDCASLNDMLGAVHKGCKDVRIMRDPTRGGLATTLVEIAEDFSLTLVIEEMKLPIKDSVHGACDLLGFDPLYLANEGKAIIIVSEQETQRVLDIVKDYRIGEDATVIGTITGIEKGQLLLRSPIGSKRLLSRLTGTMLPRIC